MASLNLKYDLSKHDTHGNLRVTFKVPTAVVIDITINWDDGGAPEHITNSPTGYVEHIYSVPNIVNISTTFNTVTTIFGTVYGQECLTECSQFPTNLSSLYFAGAKILTIVPTTLPATLTNLTNMFAGCSSFNQNIGSWNTSNVTTIQQMFEGATIFNQNIGSWNTLNINNMNSVFNNATIFNQNISSWNTSKVTDMRNMFSNTTIFNQNISSWNTSKVTDMGGLFNDAHAFNQDISSWNTSKVTDMDLMFDRAKVFNQNISGWDVSKVTTMNAMFYEAYVFNQNLSSWDVSKVTTMNGMFLGATSFNSPLLWGSKTSLVNNMSRMFSRTPLFNQDISGWNVSNVTDMSVMFYNATAFNQNISSWDISKVTTMENMFLSAHIIQRSYYDAMLTNWAALPNIKSNVPFHAGTLTHYTCNSPAATARNTVLIGSKLWTITDGACIIEGLKLVLDLTLSNQPSVRPFDISVVNATSNLTFDWGDGSTPTVKTPGSYNVSHSYGASPTNYYVTVTISGATNSCDSITLKTPYSYGCEMVTSCTDFSDITKNLSFYLASNLTSVPTILPSNMTNLESMFHACIAFNSSNVSSWNTTNVTNMKDMFGGARIFDKSLSGWNTINVANMESMFNDAQKFNGSVGTWNTGNVTNMKNMFAYAYKFNQNIGSWNTSNVQNMGGMFNSALIFDQNINTNTGAGTWVTTKVTNMGEMFRSASKFNQSLNNWNTSAVTTMYNMFSEATLFNGNISAWNVSNVLTMFGMFSDTPFNQNISGWKPNKLEDAGAMFWRASAFNQNINTNTGTGTWVTTSVKSMYGMFYEATSFNIDIGYWNTINVENMSQMFQGATIFNQDIGGWNTSKVENMEYMFTEATSFDQDISDWDVSIVTTMEDMFLDAHIIQRQYYDAMLTKWAALPVQTFVKFHAGVTTQYTCGSAAETARNTVLIASKGWNITDGGCYASVPRNFYVDITFGVANGAGTTTSPYNLSQFETATKTLEDKDTFYVRGNFEITNAYGSRTLISQLVSSTPSFEISVTMKGWDIDTNGCPIIKWSTQNPSWGEIWGNTWSNTWGTYFGYSSWGEIWGNGWGNTFSNAWGNALWGSHYDKINVNIDNFIITSPYSFAMHAGPVTGKSIIEYRTVHFVVNELFLWDYNNNTIYSNDPYSNSTYNFYGCTFNTTSMKVNDVVNLGFSDCVFDSSSIDIHSIDKLFMFNNTTNINNFISYIANINDMTNYTNPILNKEIISTPTIPNFNAFIEYYTNPNLMYYELYKIGTSNAPFVQNYRIANNYNTGIFNDLRLSYGAYGFTGIVIPDEEIFMTSGVIGSFYLGPTYDNGYTQPINLGITLSPQGTVTVSDRVTITDMPRINVAVPSMLDRNDIPYVYTTDRFNIDFVAKHRNDDTYPKFCGLRGAQPVTCNNCLTSADVLDYNTPIHGGNTLIVDFLACAEGVGEFKGYRPIENGYHWYFDYGNNPNEYVTCSGPYATYSYCGTYLEQYDVRLCVDFEFKG